MGTREGTGKYGAHLVLSPTIDGMEDGGFKIVVEPGGAVALAAALSGAYDCRGKTVCVICSGGNVDGGVFAEAIGD